MNEENKILVGIDVGTTETRCLIAQPADSKKNNIRIIGFGRAENTGFRKGTVVNINETAQSIDSAVAAAEKIAGVSIDGATLSINGGHIVSESSKGVIAVGANHEIDEDDIFRAQDAAASVRIGNNQTLLQVSPRVYTLDGQEGIRDPRGMVGMRLELDALLTNVSTQSLRNLEKAVEVAKLNVHQFITPAVAGATAILTRQQSEHGVLYVDIGASTTNIAVYEEGDLQYVAVIPVGSAHITNDLAIGLRTDIDLAESIKINHVDLNISADKKKSNLEIVINNQKHTFRYKDIDLVVRARMEEIAAMINDELAKINRNGKLPGGIVLAGGGAKLKGISQFLSAELKLPASVATVPSFVGVSEEVKDLNCAALLGLTLMDGEQDTEGLNSRKSKSSKISGALKNIFKRR
jgi:cell division protein FtsA